MVKTDHILFIAAGAFHFSKPSDLVPELQGRFPLRVELTPLSAEDFYRILTEPQNALTVQYRALIGTEGVTLTFTDEALREVANFACKVNEETENIGARRLYTIMSKKLYVGNLSFNSTEDDIRTQFATFGEVISVNLITDRETGRLRGFGFVEMDEEGARAAIQGMDGKDFGGRNLKVNEAEDKPRSGGGSGRGDRRW